MRKATVATPQISPEEFIRIRMAFANRTTSNEERPGLFRILADTLAPGWFEWHAWTNKIVEAGCRYRWIGLSGCSNSCKTFNSAGFAAVWWLADPTNSSVIFCSTTMKMLRKRGWAEIRSFNNVIDRIGGYGNFVDSRTLWQAEQGDDKHAIFGKAVCEGDTNKAAADIQGIHTKRQLIVIDEAEAVPAAIWKACANLYGYCVDVGGEFVLMALANARRRLSQFGRFIEPEGGWNSVSVDSDDWFSKPQMDGKRAIVLRFDFRKSPNVVEGKMVSRHLPSKHRVEGRLAALKARGGENDPDHWAYDLGFPAPEGLTKTVFTETLIAKHDGYGKHKFTGVNFRIIGAFDQAFGGGDRPALRFAALGEIDGGKMGIEWMEAIILYVDATSAEPVRYQLKTKLQEHCESVKYRNQTYRCLPEDFAIDCTGDGGLADICQQEWSNKINRIMFSASASDTPVSHEDERSAKEAFLNKRVEMYFRTRDALIAGQLKGIDKDTADELCNLEELVEKADGTVRPRKTLQSKKEYKLKYQVSPDLSDCGVMLTEVARLKGFMLAAVGFTTQRQGAINAMVAKTQAVYDEDTYFQADNEEVLVE